MADKLPVNKIKKKNLILLFLLSLIAEIFLFNLRTFQTAMYEEKYPDTSYTSELIGGSPDSNGNIVMNPDADCVIINYNGFGYPLKNIKLDAEWIDDVRSDQTEDHVCVAECSTFDEALFEQVDENGNSYFENASVGVVTAKILHTVKNSQYVYFEPFGNTHKLHIVLYPASDNAKTLRIHELIFNAAKPLEIKPIRILFIFVMFLLLYFSLIDPLLWQIDCVSVDRKKTWAIITLFILFSIFSVFWMTSNRSFMYNSFSPYAALVRALCKGQVYIEEASETVKNVEDKVVFWRSGSTEVLFDHALHDGKYYVYFGLLPCLVFYLPYHLATGSDLPNIFPALFLRLLTVALTGRVIWLLIKKHYPKTPFILFLLMWGSSVSGMYIPFMLSSMSFYDIPIFSGLSLTLAGICFWLRAEEDNNIIVKRLTAGSICMAAVSMCRPTMLLYGLTLISIATWNRRKLLKSYEKKHLLRIAISILLPYVFFAMISMSYNIMRFGNPLDFGSAYNATVYPIKGRSPFIPYVAYRAVYEYLLKPPFLNFSFPYAAFGQWEKIRDAGNIMVVDFVIGGLITSNPFTWSLLLSGHYAKSLKNKKLFIPLLSCVLIAFFLMVYGTVYTSFMFTRYTLEFSPSFILGGCILMMEIFNDISSVNDLFVRRILKRSIAVILLISIFWGALQLGMDINDSTPMRLGNTELWYRIVYSLRIFG